MLCRLYIKNMCAVCKDVKYNFICVYILALDNFFFFNSSISLPYDTFKGMLLFALNIIKDPRITLTG